MEFILHFITRLHLYKVETFHIVTNCNPISDPTSFTSKHCLKSVQIRSFLWPIFSCITTEYGDLLYETLYSFQIQENTDRNKLGIWTLFMQWKRQHLADDPGICHDQVHISQKCHGYRDHPFRTYLKCFEKLTFPNFWYAHLRRKISKWHWQCTWKK